MDAMVWAQAFTLYQKERPSHTLDRIDPQPYAAYLLQRCYAKVGRGEDVQRKLEEAFVAFQQKHDAKIRAGLARGSPEKAAEAGLEVLSPGPRYLGAAPSTKEEKMKTPGMALFLLGIDAEGSVQKRLVIDSLPDDTFAAGLTRIADHTRFNPAPKGSELRWAVLPMGYDNRTYAIRPKSE
jgi:hypothetical protein